MSYFGYNLPLSFNMPTLFAFGNNFFNPNIFPPKSSNIKAVIIIIIIFLGIIGALILLTRPDEKDTKKEKEKNEETEVEDLNTSINKNVVNCTFDGNLIPGAEYTNGEYTYRYKQQVKYGTVFDENIEWEYFDEDGWGVVHNNRESDKVVTTKLCTYINGKPLVSMNNMFYGSLAKGIDTSSFNTKNVIRMDSSFAVMINIENLDLSTFDTSNVKTMYFMFSNCYAKNINVSSFDTSRVEEMAGMFGSTNTTTLDISNFNTTNVSYCGMMFSSAKASTVYVKNQKQLNYFNECSSNPDTLKFTIKK